MRLDSLISESELAASGVSAELIGDLSTDVSGVVLDSRRVSIGCLFACVPGQIVDGHNFAAAAVDAGATSLLCERELDLAVSQVVVSSVRRSLGPICDTYFDHPSRKMTVVGVTGTNGKTTTCALLQSIFASNGWSAATIGTLTQARTTPEAPELQALLAGWVKQGGRAVAMEVSSHALSQHRADAVEFAAGVFTNLSAEHLDYHLTLEDYFEAKAKLFEPQRLGLAVVNRDDPFGGKLLQRLAVSGVAVETFGLSDAVGLSLDARGSRFTWDGQDVSLALGGRFNVANALAAATTARCLGVPASAIAEGLSALEGVAGRFQLVSSGQSFTVVVDYAHTPDGLKNVLEAAREISVGKLIVVFGAGGDRDRDKRPVMGEIASTGADLAIVTSDNPRGEDPMAIIRAVLTGAIGTAQMEVEPDRAKAISLGISLAGAGDVVVIAGKGHESTQEIAGRYYPFEDAVVARAALANDLSSPERRS